nr:hypothetical protein [Clostridia bacterium]
MLSKNRKALALITIFLALTSLVTSCSSETDKQDGDVSDMQSTEETTSAAPVETEYITYRSADLPDVGYDGYEFRFLTRTRTDPGTWWFIDREEQDGEVLNDAIYERNRTVEEAFDVEINAIYVSNAVTEAPKHISSGDDAFDSMFCAIDNTSVLILGKYTIDLNTVEYLDLTREWWDQTLIRDWTINDKLFFITGDISPSVNMRSYAMAFNKDLCRDLGIEFPYQTVLDGKWTLEYFSKFVRGINADINGDGLMNFDDRWGFLAVSGESTKQLVACGGMQTEVKNGRIEFVLDDEANMTRFMKTLETVADKDVTILADPYAAANGWVAVTQWFANGGALLKASCFEDIPKDLRPLDTDFGILPYPKYDEAQDEHLTLVANSGYVISLPVSCTDTERAGIILEAMAAESVNTVKTAMFDISLEGKTARDSESEVMLDLIFKNKVYDIAYGINLGGIWDVVDTLEAKKSDSIASALAANEDKMAAAIENFMKAYE